MSRKDIADSLPGVAIAIALMPPLCVIGIGLAENNYEAALGALLLFSTNFFAILLAGGGTFALLGLTTAATKTLNPVTRRRAYFFITLAVILIAIPLGATSLRIFVNNTVKQEATRLTEEWMHGTDYVIHQIEVSGNQVNLSIYGSGDRLALSELGEKLNGSLDDPVKINLVVIPSERESYVID